MQPKPKRCKVCRTEFMPWRSTQKVCKPECGIELHRIESQRKAAKDAERAQKRQRASDRKRKEALKGKPEWKKEAQAAFNAYIRERDRSQPCISCGMPPDATEALTGGYWDCGHYRSVGSMPSLRFEPLNAHKQCKRCNRQLSGNVVEYRAGLIERIGQEAVDWVEGPHEPKRYGIEDLKAIKAEYTKLARELRKEREA